MINRQQFLPQLVVPISRSLAQTPFHVAITLLSDGEVEAEARPEIPGDFEGI